ncbi:hypothetical protein AB84_1303 [Escherichia coli 2-052-05_S3_C1]|nr:hypothetical protein AB84_1303 [Escherichia coli 2-052-05_S3_C1]
MMKIKDIKKICRLENGAVDCEVLFFGMEEYLVGHCIAGRHG